MHTEKWPKDRAGYQGTLVVLQSEKSLHLKPANFFGFLLLSPRTTLHASTARPNEPRFRYFAGDFEKKELFLFYSLNYWQRYRQIQTTVLFEAFGRNQDIFRRSGGPSPTPPWTHSNCPAGGTSPQSWGTSSSVFIPDNLERSLKVKAGNEAHQR